MLTHATPEPNLTWAKNIGHQLIDRVTIQIGNDVIEPKKTTCGNCGFGKCTCGQHGARVTEYTFAPDEETVKKWESLGFKWCGKTATARCGRCRSTYFCSKECQKLAWPNHKKFCQTF